MDFQILGPLAVSVRGEAVPVRGRHQPKLLATLLLENGHVVPLHRLVDALWDDDPPGTAHRQVQNTMAALRRALSAEGPDPIEAVGQGYRLTVDRLDAREFNDGLRRARGLIEAAEYPAAHALLCRILELWRGPALAGMTGRLLGSAVTRLDEARLEAREARMDVEIKLGHPGRVAGEARQMLDDNPYRQNLARLLMSALHLNGRTVEALEVFDEMRLRLAEDLGIDPGKPLRQLHREILRAENGTTTGSSVTAAPASAPPAQLPADVATFTGRETELSALDALIDTGSNAAVLSTVTGSGGVGKTALAVHWAHSRASRFPDGQLFVNLRGYDHNAPLAATEVISRFLRALGYAADSIPPDTDEAVALYRTALHGRRMLIILDNACTVEQVRPLLPASAGSLALVTSRDALAGLIAMDDARPIGLDLLSRRESLELLSDLAGAKRLQSDPESAHRIVELCGQLPLALRIAGANLASRPHKGLAEFATELAGADRLDRLAIPGDTRAAVADGIALSFQALHVDTQRFFLLLGLIPGGDFADDLAAAAGGLTTTEAEIHVERLLSAHLLDRHRQHRSRLHDLVRLYALRRAESDLEQSERDDAIQRLLDWYEKHVDVVEHEDAMATVAVLSDHPQIWKAATGLFPAIEAGHDPAPIRRSLQASLSLARANDDTRGQAEMLNVIAVSYWATRDLAKAMAYVEQALAMSRRLGDDRLVALHLGNLAVVQSMLGERDASERLHRQALEFAERSGAGDAIAGRLNQLGILCGWLGRFDEAERFLLRALSTLPPDQARQRGRIEANLVGVYIDMGRYSDGLRHVERMYAGTDALNRRALLWRGALRQRMGQWESGHADLIAAAATDGADPHVGGMNRLVEPLAQSWMHRGELRTALDLARECLASGLKSRVIRDEALGNLLLSTIHIELKDYGTAVEHARRAVRLYERIKEPLRLGRSWLALSQAYLELGERQAAAEYRRRAVEIFERLGVTATERIPAPVDAVRLDEAID